MTHRRGVSLIETIVLMTAVSVILTLTGVLVHRTMRVHSRAQAAHADEAAAWRLSGVLRRDLASAYDAIIRSDKGVLILTLSIGGDQPVAYRFDPHGADRAQTRAGGRVANERYAFADPVEWAVEELGAPSRIRVQTTIGPVTRTKSFAPVRLRIVGRLAGAPTNAEVAP